MPLLEEMGYMPSKKYASAVEIRSHLVKMAEKFGFEDKIMYRTEADGLQWSDELLAWRADMTTRRGAQGQESAHLWVNADFVIMAAGLFPHPQVPKLPGLTGFEGTMFHTSRWNYDVTGGSSEDPFPNMDKLKGKRVGIIGTGATAIQVVPELAKYAKELYVFQRTPSQVNPRGQRDTDLAEWRERIAAKPGWQKIRAENMAKHVQNIAKEGEENLVGDAWTELKAYCTIIGTERFGIITPDKVPEHIGTVMAMDAENTARVRARVSEIVKDKDTAAKLTPWYPTWCKRPTFSDLFLQTFNRENVHLVDTNGKGVESVTPQGIRANGQEYPIDVLVLSTGYRSPGAGAGNPVVRSGMEVTGRDGQRFSEKWQSQGATTLHGCGSNGFPNFFILGLSQVGASVNVGHLLTVLSSHVGYIIKRAHELVGDTGKKGLLIEATKSAEEEWSMQIIQGATLFAPVVGCTPGYITSEGEAMSSERSMEDNLKAARGGPWPAGMTRFVRELEAWESEGNMKGFQVSVA